MNPEASLPTPLPQRADAIESLLGLGLALALHLGAIGWIVSAHRGAAETMEAEELVLLPVISTELLRWGEQMPDPNELPEIANPAPADERDLALDPPPEEVTPAPVETEVVDLQDSVAVADPAERDTELRRDEIERQTDAPRTPYRGDHNPNRPVNDVAIPGSPDGFLGGTSLDASAQRNQLSRIQQQLNRAFQPPQSLSEEQRRRLTFRVHIRFSPAGQITEWEVDRSSGNRLFDMYAERALDQFRTGTERLDVNSIADEALRARVLRDGFVAEMKGN